MVFASHTGCFPLGTGEKEQLSKTPQAFFKQPLLKVSFDSSTQTLRDESCPSLPILSASRRTAHVVRPVAEVVSFSFAERFI